MTTRSFIEQMLPSTGRHGEGFEPATFRSAAPRPAADLYPPSHASRRRFINRSSLSPRHLLKTCSALPIQRHGVLFLKSCAALLSSNSANLPHLQPLQCVRGVLMSVCFCLFRQGGFCLSVLARSLPSDPPRVPVSHPLLGSSAAGVFKELCER